MPREQRSLLRAQAEIFVDQQASSRRTRGIGGAPR
jgi:hypothetical protein